MGKGTRDGAKASAATIDVYVKLPNGKVTQFDLLSSDTVQTIYTKIAGELEISEDRLQVKYQGKVLKKIHSLGYLGVCRETILKAEVIEVKRWTIYVKLATGETIPVDLDNLTQVKYIKDYIKSRDGISPGRQILKISNRVLDNMSQKVMDAGITNEAILTLEVTNELAPKSVKSTKKSGATAHSESWSEGECDEDGEADEACDVTEEDKQVETELDSSSGAVLDTFDAAGRNVEVVFSFDTTGSMSSCLHEVRNKLKQLVRKLLADIPNIRIGIIAHGDYCDYNTYVVKIQDLTSDVDTLVNFAQSTPSTGGGDMPEAYEWVLHKAQQLEWSENSAKALVMIGDAIPQAPSYTDQHTNWHTELDILKGMGVKVYGVQAMNIGGATEFYKELAEQTGGAYVRFTNFSIISDMFMAVCYREVDYKHLQNFQEELEAEGNMTEEVKEVIQQIQESPRQPTNQPTQRYVAQAWWDPELDNGNCQYSYNERKDSWGPYVTPAKKILKGITSTLKKSDSESVSSSGSSSSEPRRSRSIKSRLSFRRKKSSTTGSDAAAADTPACNKGSCEIM